MKSSREASNILMLCQKIALIWDQQSFTDHSHELIMNQINMIGDRSKCYNDGTVGLHVHIAIGIAKSLTINVINSLFMQEP